jgi:hypothetical protein
MSSAIVPTDQHTQIQTGGLGLSGLGDLRPTSMLLVQPTTDVEGVLPGLYLDKLSGTTWKTLKLVPLRISHVRDKYPSDKFVKGEKPICKSFDGVYPITNNSDLVPQAPNCSVCPHSSWAGYNNRTKTGIKPSCKEGVSILFIEQESGLPFWINLIGKSVREGKQLKEAILRNAKMAKARTKRNVNIFDYVVTMASEKDTGSPAYIAKFRKVDLMTPEEAEMFGPMYMQIVERKNQLEKEQAADDGAGEIMDEGQQESI